MPRLGAANAVQLDGSLREAAANAAVLGDGVGLSGRYRDSEFFIPDHQTGNRSFEEQEFSVKGGTASQLDGAVLDLMADDQVEACIVIPWHSFARFSSNKQDPLRQRSADGIKNIIIRPICCQRFIAGIEWCLG